MAKQKQIPYIGATRRSDRWGIVSSFQSTARKRTVTSPPLSLFCHMNYDVPRLFYHSNTDRLCCGILSDWATTTVRWRDRVPLRPTPPKGSGNTTITTSIFEKTFSTNIMFRTNNTVL